MSLFMDIFEKNKWLSAKILIFYIAKSVFLILSETNFLDDFIVICSLIFMLGYIFCEFFCKQNCAKLKNELYNKIHTEIYEFSFAKKEFSSSLNDEIAKNYRNKPSTLSENQTYILENLTFSLATITLSLLIFFFYETWVGLLAVSVLFLTAFFAVFYFKTNKNLKSQLHEKSIFEREISTDIFQNSSTATYDFSDKKTIQDEISALQKKLKNRKLFSRIILFVTLGTLFFSTVYFIKVMAIYSENALFSLGRADFLSTVFLLFFISVAVLFFVFEGYFELKKSAKKYAEFIVSNEITEDKTEEITAFLPTGELNFSGVFYQDKASGKSFDGFSLKISTGEKVAIVGGIELFSLCKNLCDFTDGEIYFCGIPTKKIPTEYLKNKVSYVFKEPSYIVGSIFENIKLGNENISEEDIIGSLKLLGIYDYINNNYRGIYSNIMNLPLDLKEKIAFARSIAKNPQIIFLENDLLPTSLNEKISDISIVSFCDFQDKLEKYDKIAFFSDGVLTAVGKLSDLEQNCVEFRAKRNIFAEKNQVEEGSMWQEILKNS